MTDAEYFNHKCPYTDKPCYHDWGCTNCEVDAEEREWMEMMANEEDAYYEAQSRNDT